MSKLFYACNALLAKVQQAHISLSSQQKAMEIKLSAMLSFRSSLLETRLFVLSSPWISQLCIPQHHAWCQRRMGSSCLLPVHHLFLLRVRIPLRESLEEKMPPWTTMLCLENDQFTFDEAGEGVKEE
jgi:hypothetical protein